MTKKLATPPFRAFFRDGALGIQSIMRDGLGYGLVHAIHKCNYDESPYCVANEIICGELGRAIGVPVPPCALTLSDTDKKRRVLFSSLDFNDTRDKLPRVLPDICVKKLEYECVGILCFDIVIANPDRGAWNARVDMASDPSNISIFDHEKAMFGTNLNEGAKRLSKEFLSLGLRFEWPEALYDHIFLDLVSSTEHFPAWSHRIECLPQWIIRDIVMRPYEHGLITAAERDAAIEFLTYRTRNFQSIVANHKSEFGLMQWGKCGEIFKWPQDS